MSLKILQETLGRLFDKKNGCPWHAEQSHESLSPYLIEEAYELKGALAGTDNGALKDELGDVLLQVLLHAQIAENQGHFTFDDVCKGLSDKIRQRQPYMFTGEDTSNLTSDDVFRLWLENKEKSKKKASQDLETPKLPALIAAQKIQGKAASYNFEWRNLTNVLAKIEEELSELKEALQKKDKAHIKEELGDLLFVLANLGRYIDIDAEDALQKANAKFVKRFNGMLADSESQGDEFKKLDSEAMMSLWRAQKRK